MYNKEKTLEIDKKYMWHPFTQMKDYEHIDHKVIVRADGIKLYDADNNEYYDTISSWWTNILGHNNKFINRALIRQIKKLDHVHFSGLTHPYAAELIDRLRRFVPKMLTKYFFSDNGSTSTEIALKLAFQYFQNKGESQKTKFVKLQNAYHGDTIGAFSLGGINKYQEIYKPLLFDTFEAPSPDCSNCPHRKSQFTFDALDTGCSIQCFNKMRQILKNNAGEIAGVIVEPIVQGAAGMRVYPPKYLKRLRTLTKKLGIFLIFDEVATGIGRTGTMFALEHSNTVPDILCMSKSITNGYLPLAITVAKQEIYDAFYADHLSNKTFNHGHSFTANPLACSVAIETLKQLKKHKLPKSNQSIAKHFHDKLKDFSKHDFIKDIRYKGFIGAIDITKSRKDGIDFDESIRIGNRIYRESVENGLILRPLGNTIYWVLPLVITKKDIDIIMNKSEEVIRKVVNEA